MASEHHKELKYDIFSQSAKMVKRVLFSFIVIITILFRTTSFADAQRGKCGLPVSSLGQVCHICKTFAKQDMHIQNRSIRIKAACVGLANKNCCNGLYIFSAGLSKIFITEKQDLPSVTLGFMWLKMFEPQFSLNFEMLIINMLTHNSLSKSFGYFFQVHDSN